jgi:hypothetical protein
MPDIKCLGSDRTICICWHLVPARMEVCMDECVSGEEVLCLAGRFEPLHLSLSPSRWPM